MEKGNPMRLKNLCALFLLLMGSVYFICPVQCAAVEEVDGHAASNTASIYQRYLTEPQSTIEDTESTCCSNEGESADTHESREQKGQHCCFTRWESLGDSEPQLPSQIQKTTYLFVVLVPATSRICSISLFLTGHLQVAYSPYTNPSISQQLPRAPPFILT